MPSTEKIAVTIAKGGSGDCSHEARRVRRDPIEPLHRRDFKKEEADGIEWTISNSCGKAQDVLLCVYTKTSPHKLVTRRVFHRCDPRSRDIGTPFEVVDGQTAIVDCRALRDGKYLKAIFIDDAIEDCPGSIHGVNPVRPMTHALDVAIVP